MRSWFDKAKVQFGGKLAQNAGWSFLGQTMSTILQAGCFVIIARLLGSTNYGIYTAALRWSRSSANIAHWDPGSYFCGVLARIGVPFPSTGETSS